MPHRTALRCEAERNVDAGKTRVAQVIDSVYVDNKNVLRVEPIAGPWVSESKPIASVLKAVISVVRLADVKCVLPSEIGLETGLRNAATAAIAGALGLLCIILLCRLCVLLCLFCVLLFRFSTFSPLR